MNSTILAVLSSALVIAFVGCCLASALLQLIAWSRHARQGAPVSLRALWHPEGFFDDIGLHQIRLARRLLAVGGWAYVSYGALILVDRVLS